MKNKFWDFIEHERNQEYFQNLMKKIEIEKQRHNVFPEDKNIFECLKYCEPEDLKLIIIGQDPYYLKDQADGLAFSTQNKQCPKSLQNILKELKKDYPNTIIETYSLKSWAKQGVLLLNSSLTVNENMPKSHSNFGWKIFVSNLLDYIIKLNNKVIFGIWGNDALALVKNKIDNNRIIFTTHPSPLAYAKTNHSFKDSNFFIKVNNKLEEKINFDLRKE
ncbi:uracil-DNA glycosylase [Mycoplasmopsis primatum]|uniref:uracil-DNA glycosylase n=1 Tax=Mycoplasmopsis primatum TaxID=55604 RepID=UPI000498152C|nr:uracil-DNA glycosylase [Mycoplasmopsis primatum]